MMMAVIADVSADWDDRSRTLALMILETSGSVGGLIGPVLGASVAEAFGLRNSFLMTALIMAAPIVVIVCLPETLPRRQPFYWRKANIIAQVKVLTEHRAFVCIGLGFFVMSVIGAGQVNNMYLIKVVRFSTMQLAKVMTVIFVVNIVGMLAGLPLLQRCLDNRQILILCMVSATIGLGLWACLSIPALQQLPWLPYAIQVVGQPGSGLVGACMFPCFRATIALVCASGEAQSSVAMALGSFGAEQSVVMVSSALSPLLYMQPRKG